MLVSRRRFFGLLAAPAIVHAGNLMPVKVLGSIYEATSPLWTDYGVLPQLTRQEFLPWLQVQLWTRTPVQVWLENGGLEA